MTIRNKNSVNEILRKSMGGVTYSECKGQSILRSRITRNTSSTPLQQRQRKRWPEYSNLADACWDALEIGFPGRPRKQSPYNAFVKANKDAVTVDEQLNVSIAYEKVVCSQGKVSTPDVHVTLDLEQSSLRFTPQSSTLYGRRSAGDDKLYALVVEKSLQQGFLSTLGTRQESTPTGVPLPPEWDAEELAIYVFATSTNGRKASKSKYVTPTTD